MKVQEFNETLMNAVAGQRIVYYIGHLIFDRQNLFDPDKATAANEIGKRAYEAYEAGAVMLVARKLAPFVYEYIAEVPPAIATRAPRHLTAARGAR